KRINNILRLINNFAHDASPMLSVADPVAPGQTRCDQVRRGGEPPSRCSRRLSGTAGSCQWGHAVSGPAGTGFEPARGVAPGAACRGAKGHKVAWLPGSTPTRA